MRKFSCDGLGRIDKQNKRKRLDAKLQDKGGSSNVYESGANYRREREKEERKERAEWNHQPSRARNHVYIHIRTMSNNKEKRTSQEENKRQLSTSRCVSVITGTQNVQIESRSMLTYARKPAISLQ